MIRLSRAPLLGLLALSSGLTASAHAAPSLAAPAQAHLQAAYGNLPLSFEANRGQSDKQVKFLARGSGYGLFLTPTQAVLSLQQSGKAKAAAKASVLRMQMVGANANPRVSGQDALPGTVNYFTGKDPKKWRTNIATYKKVAYQSVYKGVDLVYYGNHKQLEYDFIVQPHADPKQIALSFSGAKSVKVAKNGDLALSLAGGSVVWRKPVVYQTVGGVRQTIAGKYVVSGHQAHFQVAAYDKAEPLVIDPVLAYSTYLGGSQNEHGNAIAVDGSGNAYVTGYTYSANFPTTPGASQISYKGSGQYNHDAYVSKLNASGTGLLYSTYLGGDGDNSGNAIAVDDSGNAYVTGVADSANFPTTPGAFQTTPGGGGDAFVTKLNASGTGLFYSTYLGGSGIDITYGIVVDSSGNAYVTGTAYSADFPTTPGAFQTTRGGGDNSNNAFVTKLNASGTGLFYSTYLGGSGHDYCYGIAIDSSNNAYVTGGTTSANFPITLGAFQTIYNGSGYDAFVCKLNTAGTGLLYSTYLDGKTGYYTSGFAIALDHSGNAYVAGGTNCTDFPTTPGAFATTPSGGFVTKLNASGTGLLYSTYLGADNAAIAVDSSGNAYLTGVSSPPNSGTQSAFVSQLNASGTSVLYYTSLGNSSSPDGTDGTGGSGIAVDGSGNVYLVGTTFAANFPTTPGVVQPNYGGGTSDAFVAKIAFSNWRVTSVAAGPDGRTRLLWNNNVNRGVAVWSVNDGTGQFDPKFYGPYAGWTATAIAAGPNGLNRILWNNDNGGVALWDQDPNTAQFTTHFYGPYAGWTAKAIAVGPDNKTRMLWVNVNGGVTVWDIDDNSGQFTQFYYGPYSGWTATSLSVGPDGKTRLLWNNVNRQVALWDLDNGTGQFTPYFYGPDADWTATAVSMGADNRTRMLWNRPSGQARVWEIDEASGSYRHFEYGPYAGWSANALSVGTDSGTRLLWDNVDGTAALWDVSTGSGSFAANFFGPY